MQTSTLSHWHESDNQDESLAVAVRSVLANSGNLRTYEELLAILGLGAAVVAVPDDRLGHWFTYARDAALEPAAVLCGLRLRHLHPPAASAGLSRSAEFAQHFHDSYVPLIKEALEHGQPVLAWRGWPPPRDRLWGVVTHTEGGMLFGRTLWHDGRPLPLTGPAHQVYVIEQVNADALDELSATQRFRHVRIQALAAWHNDWSHVPGVITGAAAYEAWSALLHKGDRYGPDAPRLHRQHCHSTGLLIAARDALATWLRKTVGNLAGSQPKAAAHWANVCDEVVELLTPYASREEVEPLLTNPAGVERVCYALEEAGRIETSLMTELATVK